MARPRSSRSRKGSITRWYIGWPSHGPAPRICGQLRRRWQTSQHAARRVGARIAFDHEVLGFQFLYEIQPFDALEETGAVSFVSGTLVPGRMSWMGCSTGGRLSGGFRSTFLKRRLDQRQQHGCHPQRHDHVAPWRPHPCRGMKCERGSNDEEDTAAVLNFCKPSSSVKDSGKGRNIILLQKGSRLGNYAPSSQGRRKGTRMMLEITKAAVRSSVSQRKKAE